MSTRIIVTGGNGQLGRSLKDILVDYPELEACFIDIDNLDLTNKTQVEDYFENHKCEILINCAAYTAVDKAEAEPEKAMAINKTAVENIAKSAQKHNFKIIHISTDYVFDGQGETPYKETQSPNPQSVYGRTKMAGEETLSGLIKDAIIIRTAWLYSKYGKNFFLTMRDKAMKGEEVRVVNDQKGTPTNAMDLAKAILEIISSNNWIPGIYHYTNQGETTWCDFTKEIYRLFNSETDLVKPITSAEYPTAARRPKYSVLDKTKIIDTYGLSIPTWEKSLEELVKSKEI